MRAPWRPTGKDTGVVGYNVQAVVDAKDHLIVAHEVTNIGNDRSQLSTMAKQVQEARNGASRANPQQRRTIFEARKRPSLGKRFDLFAPRLGPRARQCCSVALSPARGHWGGLGERSRVGRGPEGGGLRR